jgi:hypothetical protein
MNLRLCIVIVAVIGSACSEFSMFSSGGGPSGDAGGGSSGAGAAAGGVPGVGASNGADFFPAFDTADAGAPSNLVDGIAIAPGDAGSFAIVPPWGADAGVDPLTVGAEFPDPSSLPLARDDAAALALASEPSGAVDAGVSACREPPSCYLRTMIVTRRGHVYSARLSTSSPKDSCVTKVISCDHNVLVGDSKGRFADTMCGSASPQITFGFLVPQTLLFGWTSGQVWESTSGFKSEWTLAGAGDDSGSYEPAPGFTSKLWPLWSRFFAGGEVYGEMFVPLRHSMTHELALGFALFDIRVRQ